VVSIAVPASLKVASLKELIAMVREQPGKLNWTSATGVTDLIIAGYLKSAGLEMVRVPYKDPASAVNDLVEGRIQFYSSAYAIVRAQAQGGRLRVLAIQTRSRAPALPELQTVAEAGFPGLNFDGLVGLLAARASNLPEAARERIAADVRTVLGDPVISGPPDRDRADRQPGHGGRIRRGDRRAGRTSCRHHQAARAEARAVTQMRFLLVAVLALFCSSAFRRLQGGSAAGA